MMLERQLVSTEVDGEPLREGVRQMTITLIETAEKRGNYHVPILCIHAFNLFPFQL